MNVTKILSPKPYGDVWRELKSQVRWTLARLFDGPAYHLDFHIAQQRIYTFLWLSLFVLVSALIGLKIWGSDAQWVWLAWAIYLIGALCILWKPVNGLYLTLFFSLVGDSVLAPAYPFNKNFSSAESLFFINDKMIVSALEVYLVLTLLSWLIRGIARKNLNFRWGPVGGIMLFFLICIVLGLAYGLSRGGDLNIALWEARALFYLPAMYFLAANLLEDKKQVNLLIWSAMIAIFIQSVVGVWTFFSVYHGSLQSTESIMEHSASIHTNTLIVLILAAWLYRGSWAKRWLLPVMGLPVLFAYLANQRRASYVALGIALLLILVALFRENRRGFKILAPLVIITASIYLAAFWNNDSLIGMPARGIRTALVTTTGTRDYSSNLYRLIENVNTTFTIRANMLLGVGFGNKFMILVPMPDISFFVWWEYITHNSILWMWIKMGIPGFIALLLLVGAAIVMGVDVYDRLSDRDSKAIGLTMVLYLVMHFIYAYVDMSWDVQSMVYLGAAMGILAALGGMLARPERERDARPALFAKKTG